METISVVIPYYNDSTTIKRALHSVNLQTCKPLEVIIVNDASLATERDDLYAIVSQYEKELNLKIIDLERNSGPSAARNRGWNEATGDNIAFLDADDSWLPQKLEIQLKVMQSENLGIVATRSAQDSPILFFDLNDDLNFTEVTVRQQLFRNRFRTSSIIIARKFAVRFNEAWRRAEDFDVWCRIMLKGHRAGIIELPLTSYHKDLRSSVGLSGNMWKMFIGEFRVYVELRREKLINYQQGITCYVSSILRFGRRIILILISRFRKLR